MIREEDLRNIIQEVMANITNGEGQNTERKIVEGINSSMEDISDKDIVDITAIKMKDQLLVEHPKNKEGYMHLKESTPARVGVGRVGTRCTTTPYLRFRADHAVAMDAVFTYVSEDFLNDWGLQTFVSLCQDKDEFITRPDLGRNFSDEVLEKIKALSPNKPKVQIFVADGLSSTAIETNARDTYESMVQGLKSAGIEVGTPFFVKHGRVGTMDAVGEATGAEVVALLVGERPGLATGESMSCYMAYKPTVGMPESRRTVVSNIHQGGTPAVEAGAHIADVIQEMLKQEASGLDLKI